MKHALFSTILLAIASTGSASAHDVWLTIVGEPSQRRVIVNYGHPDDRPPPFADKIVDLVEIGAQGRRSMLDGVEPAVVRNIFVVETKPFADDGHSLVAARYDNGLWVKLPDGSYRNATRRLAPDATEAMWSVKFAKALTGSGAPWQATLGHELEIVPLADPAILHPGQTLRVKVLFRGKPLSGGEVERGDGTTVVAEKDIPKFATDADGIAEIPIISSGPHLLVIDYRSEPSGMPHEANVDLFNATLWFIAEGK